jgi:glyoxylase-like metal-dependent hydrolase (beta-lactamase superfamily II)
MELLPDIHLVDGVTCNVYLLLEPGIVTLIDTGLPGSAAKVLAYLRTLGCDPLDLQRIILTHQHVDHIGGLAALAAQTGAEVIAPAGDTPAIEGRAPRELPKGPLRPAFSLFLLPRLQTAKVTRQVRPGERIPVFEADGGLRVIDTPGHTLGHASFYLPGRRLLFVGDAYRHAGKRIAPPPRMFTTDMTMARRSLAALARLDVDASLPGHGAPILRDAGEHLSATIAALRLS